jgi:hypothetical protein
MTAARRAESKDPRAVSGSRSEAIGSKQGEGQGNEQKSGVRAAIAAAKKMATTK